MTQNINAEIISIGTEILLGEITDTNSGFIARALRDIGVNVYYISSVGDNEERITSIIRQALNRSDVVITCGGLGPTVDDMTRQAVAKATRRELIFHQDLLDTIAERFASFRVKMTENNRRQAYLPDKAILIENPVGTAPSFAVEQDNRIVISLPGVPREMMFLMREKVVPFLRQRFQLGVIKARTLRTAGIGESALDDMIGTALLEQNNPTVGLAAHHGSVDIRLTAKADSEQIADAMLDTVETRVREKVGMFIFGVNEDRLDAVLAALLEKHQVSLAVVEAGIHDVITSRLNATDRSSALQISTRTYKDPNTLGDELSVLGSDLRELASFAAEKYCQDTEATIGIAVLSTLDAADKADSEQATAVAVYMDGISRSRVYGFGAESELAREWVSNWSLATVWRFLIDKFSSQR